MRIFQFQILESLVCYEFKCRKFISLLSQIGFGNDKLSSYRWLCVEIISFGRLLVAAAIATDEIGCLFDKYTTSTMLMFIVIITFYMVRFLYGAIYLVVVLQIYFFKSYLLTYKY